MKKFMQPFYFGENMIWPFVLCALIMGMGIYWSIPHGK